MHPLAVVARVLLLWCWAEFWQFEPIAVLPQINITIIESVTQIHLFGIPSFILFDRIAVSFLTAFVIMDISPLFCCLSCIVLFSIK